MERAPARPIGLRGGYGPPEPSAQDTAGDHDEGWLFSFVDILTVLVTLLVLLLAYTYAAPPKAARGPEAGAPSGQPPVPAPRAPEQKVTAPDDTTPKAADARTASRRPMPRSTAFPASATRLGPPVPPALGDRVTITRTGQRMNLAISDDVLFNVASARLTPAGKAVLDRVAGMLKNTDVPVSVEGHTDDTPIHTPRYPSNWELSTARATDVTRYLIERGIDAERLRAVGYGATRPVAGNDTPAGRAENRRVALVLHLNRRTHARPPSGQDAAGR